MPLTPANATRLITAIDNGTLVVLCGAGLSQAPPSNLPSARDVSRLCFDRRRAIEELRPELRDDIEGLARYFYDRGDFPTTFLPLVPWGELLGEPNPGHAAIADFLVTRSVHAAVSANVDPLIEQWAERKKVFLAPALTGAEAAGTTTHSSLLKIHGCIHKSLENTIWCHAQLTDGDTRLRLDGCATWLSLLLPRKDLLVIGFWTDWGYLNDVLATACATAGALSVTVVDPAPSDELRTKAPQLWAVLNALSPRFTHITESGAVVLDEVRRQFSTAWMRRFYSLGVPMLLAEGKSTPSTELPASLQSDDLYAMRQDAEGMPHDRAVTHGHPPSHAAECAFAQMLLLIAGATRDDSNFLHMGQTIRVLNGAGQGLSQVKGRHKVAPSVKDPDVVVCAGAFDYGTPPRIVASGRGASTVRPAAGGSARWLTLEDARSALRI